MDTACRSSSIHFLDRLTGFFTAVGIQLDYRVTEWQRNRGTKEMKKPDTIKIKDNLKIKDKNTRLKR